MPVLNGRAQIGAGVAGGIINIDNVAIASGGGAVWLTDDLLMFYGPDGNLGWALREYDQQSQQFTLIDPRAASFLAAGGGLFAAQTNPLLANFPFLAGSVMSLVITDGRGAASPDGLVALCDDPSCTSFTIYDASGARLSHVPAVAYNLQLLSPTDAIWDGGAVGPFGTSIKTSVPMTRRRVARLPDGDWVVGWSDGIGLVAQLSGATDGYIVVASPGLAYHHDARAIGGELVVCWATSPGEPPGTNIKIVVDRSQPRVALPPPAPIVIPTFHFDKPVLVAPFKDPNHETAFSMEILPNQAAQQTTRPVIPAADSLAGVKGPIQGIYSEAVDPTADLALAQQHNTRLFIAHDAADYWKLPTGLRSFDVPMMECYLQVVNGVKETPDQAYKRCLAVLGSIEEQWSGPVIGLIPMFYCEGGAPPNETFTVAEVCAWLQYFSKFVNGSIRPVFIAPFEYLRANGVTGHPELQKALDNLLAEQQRVGVASLPPVEGDFMIDPKTVILYKAQKASQQSGCVNLILADGSVFSCQSDGSPGSRPAGSDGTWEQAQVSGNLATFHTWEGEGDKKVHHYFAFGIAPIDKVL